MMGDKTVHDGAWSASTSFTVDEKNPQKNNVNHPTSTGTKKPKKNSKYTVTIFGLRNKTLC